MQPLRALPQRCCRPTRNICRPRAVGVAVFLVCSLACFPRGMTAWADFTQDCSGFAQDPLLQSFRSGPAEPGAAQRSTALLAMVPRLSLRGMALATYASRPAAPTAPTLETVFGMAEGSPREIVETPFSQEARAVVLHPQILATVAHALTPDVVEVQVAAPQTSVQTVPLRVTSMAVIAQTTPDAPRVPAQVAHVNMPYDLALLQTDENQALQPLPFAGVLSYGTGDADKPTEGLQAGDCVATVVTARLGKTQDSGEDRLVLGKVLARVPVATNSLTQTKLNVNMFTTDLAVQPGDSGAPVLALRAGKPVLVGLVSATMYPTATFTYVSRLDPLLALADALRLAAFGQTKPFLVQSLDAETPESH